MQEKEFKGRYELFKRYIIRHYLKLSYIESRSRECINEIIIEDLKTHVYFLKKGSVFLAYDIKIEKGNNPNEFKQTCKSIELDFKGFFEIYPTIFAYIKEFNKRQNETKIDNI